MRFYIFSALMGLSLQSFAAPSPFLPNMSGKKILCESSLKEKLEIEFSHQSPNWNREVDAEAMTMTFRAAKKIGEWYELQISESAAPKLLYFSANKTKDFLWNADTCQFTTIEGRGLVLFHQEKNYPIDSFTDQDLEKLLARKSRGIIYVWSPHMVFSFTEFRTFRDVAKKKHLEFIPVLDPSAGVREAAAAAKKVHAEFKGRKLASVDLYMRNATLHFPTVFVFANGKINTHRLIGILPKKGLAQGIDQWMEELK